MTQLTTHTGTEERALALLGEGIPAHIVAATCGVSESRISQLVSDPNFAAQVAELRFANLQKHNARDNRYDTMEDKLLDKLDDLLPLMVRPMEVIRAITAINSAKRRGSSAPDAKLQQQTVINLTLPTQIIQKYQVQINAQNLVPQAGDQTLVTLQSGALLDRVKKGAQNDSAKSVGQLSLQAG